MKHLTVGIVMLVAGSCTILRAQYSNTLTQQQRLNAEYKNLGNSTRRAFSVPDRPASSPSRTAPSSNSQSPSSSSRSTISGSGTAAPDNATGWKTRSEVNAERAAAAQEAASYMELRRSVEEEKARLHEAVVAEGVANANRVIEDRREFFREQIKAYEGSILSPVDIRDILYDAYWLKTAKAGGVDYRSAADAYMAFVRDSSSASYDTLMARAKRTRLLPYATSRVHAKLRERFPERIEAIEQDELMAKAYYFGANRPNVFMGSNGSIAYPVSRVEDSELGNDLRAAMVKRFVALSNKYPQQAMIAAGYCRPHTSPFLLYAKWCKNDSCRADMYTRVLYTRMARMGRDYEGYSSWDQSRYDMDRRMELQLGIAGPWLAANRQEQLERITTEEWRSIAEGQDLPAERLAWILRDPAKPDDYKKRFSALQKAIKKER